MKNTKLILWIGLSIVILVIVGLVGYVKIVLPKVDKPEDITIEFTQERIERGKYLANSVCVCMDCHSMRNWNEFSGPMVEGTQGMGGEEFSQELGFPGKYYAKNITPFALKDWTDGEILRAITTGVGKDGKALFPIMPYLNYGKMDREDLYSIIAYIRTLSPIESQVPESVSDFPMSLIINTIPQNATFSTCPDKNDTVAYGKYIFTAAGCFECHTKQEQGKPVEGMEMAGGFKFPLSTGGYVYSANITPDKETGIGTWTEEAFVNRFKAFADSSYKPVAITKGSFNTYMPWMMYSSMKEEDLKALFAYLQTLEPVKNNVTKFIGE